MNSLLAAGGRRVRALPRRLSDCARPRVIAIVSLVLLSCDTPGIRLVYPDVPASGSTGVTFQVTLEDSALAQALGWSNGVPGATVILQRVTEPFAPESLTTDSLGRAHMGDILPGQFKIAAYRVLAESETGPTSGLLRAFGDGRIRDVGRGDTVSMTLLADNSGSLVFSEWWTKGSGNYIIAHYLELYNNSDTTIYLDGMLIGTVWPIVADIGDLSCAESEVWRNDPLGVWSGSIHRFPGSGRDYPVAPGQAVVVARDAVDHSVVDVGLPDLSDADFEFEGAADVDNPDVPNIMNLGPTMAAVDGSGLWFSCGTIFLAMATDFELLERRRNFRGYDYARIPTELILDVVRIVDGYYYQTETFPARCAEVAPRGLERLEGGEFLTWEDLTLAAHRRILRATADGRLVLQDVNTSAVDFVPGTRTPGTVIW